MFAKEGGNFARADRYRIYCCGNQHSAWDYWQLIALQGLVEDLIRLLVGQRQFCALRATSWNTGEFRPLYRCGSRMGSYVGLFSFVAK